MTLQIDYSKFPDHLVPAIIQDAFTKQVLMLGYMNEEAVSITNTSKKVTFYSRSKGRIWTKGEESGHFLNLVSMEVDCDNDALLIMAHPDGSVCHKGTETCWGDTNKPHFGFISTLEETIKDRRMDMQNPDSYVASLFRKGINKIAQKVGEEAVEVVIEAKDDNDILFLNESADLLFHYLILLQAKGCTLKDVAAILKERHK